MFLQTLVPSLSEEAHTRILQRCLTVACCLMGTLKQTSQSCLQRTLINLYTKLNHFYMVFLGIVCKIKLAALFCIFEVCLLVLYEYYSIQCYSN